jgi:hypothetical protein
VLRLLALLAFALLASAEDRDADGLDDALEQSLLERFRPSFLISHGECAGLPAAFAPGEKEPRALRKDGTLYGRVTPTGPGIIELQFFHLWTPDCGRFGHPLDVEHVSALLINTKDNQWRARYWRASAHQETACDAGHGLKAGAVDAERRGPRVWISLGKHASYLSPSLCKWGCGADDCREMRKLPAGPLVNLGEPGRWLNGAVWADSPQWALAAKMKPEFDPLTIERLENPKKDRAVALHNGNPALQAVLLGGDSTLDGLSTGNRHTGSALETATGHTERALGTARRQVERFLGLKPKP